MSPLDWGTVGQRRASKEPPDKGGWNIFHTWHAGADCVNPAPYIALDCSGDTAWFGWPKSELVQEKIAAWYAAPDLAAEKAVIARAQQGGDGTRGLRADRLLQGLPGLAEECVGRVKAPFPVFWDVTKA